MFKSRFQLQKDAPQIGFTSQFAGFLLCFIDCVTALLLVYLLAYEGNSKKQNARSRSPGPWWLHAAQMEVDKILLALPRDLGGLGDRGVTIGVADGGFLDNEQALLNASLGGHVVVCAVALD